MDSTRTPEESALGRSVAGLPVPVWGALASCASMIIGWNWDISWHRSIGRDTTWTLPHIAIYVALAIAFAYNATLLFAHTFGALRDAPGVRVLGVKGPSAAFLTLWGLLLQFASILFDNWWHGVYGVDVDVFSPPHGLLAWGIAVFYLGQFGIVALYRNNAPAALERRSRFVAIVIWAMFLGHMAIAPDPFFGPAAVRSVFFVVSTTMTFPVGMILINAYLGRRDGAALAAAAYFVVQIVLMQIFQLFPASPQFGPVFHRIPNFLPPPFPLLLVVPAAALGLMLPGDRDRFSFARYLGAGLVFTTAFTTTNWLLSGFLLSPLARNRFFGGHYPGIVFEPEFRRVVPLGPNLMSVLALLAAVIGASFWCWVGYRGGRWLRKVVR